MIGIRLSGKGIGDKIQFTSFPENHYRNTSEKVVDVDKSWVFNYNPYVVRDVEPDFIIDLWTLGNRYHRRSCWRRWFLPTRGVYKRRVRYRPPSYFLPSVAERTCAFFGHKTFLRHPRLYIHEDVELRPNQICVHLDGQSTGSVPNFVVEQIYANYQGFDIVQIGGENDQPRLQFRSLIGLPIFESCRVIAESLLFIGVSSSMMNAALAYPRVNKRIIVTESDDTVLERMMPMDVREPHYHWLDHSLVLFNKTEHDVGATFSYRKI